MATFEEHIVDLMLAVHPLDRVARAGYVLRGVTEPESVAAHSHFVALLTLLVVEQYPDRFDARKALAMALIHDLAEYRLMDIPMPASDAWLREAKAMAEQHIVEALFDGLGEQYAAWHAELLEAASPEARLIKGLDKVQMMLKVMAYQAEGRGRLDEFWQHAGNFRDYGLEPVAKLFDALCARAGRERPRHD